MNKHLPVILHVYLLFACSSARMGVQMQYRNYVIDPVRHADSGMQQLLQPYTDSLHVSMKKVIGFATSTLYKKQPESPLGNFMADALRVMAQKKFGIPVDVALINYGGVRSILRKGEVTTGDVYQLMPFDNLVVVQRLKGNVLRELLDHIAAANGWPCSGVQMTIRNRQAADVRINGKTLDENRVYLVANTDYIAAGGDNCNMLRGVETYNQGYLFRDALVEYIEELTKQGTPVMAALENRTIYVHD